MTSTQNGIGLAKVGTRIYFVGNTYAIKDQIKSMRGHWDGDRKQWWVGTSKAKDAEALVDRVNGTATSTPDAPPAKEDADDIRLVGKAKYKGRTYYCRWVGETKDGEYKCRLVTLDQSVDFWAACARPHESHIDGSGDVAGIVKTYSPREVWDGRRYSGKTRTEYTTLGSIKRFIERQKDPETRRGECTECGAHGPVGQSCSECGGEGSYV